MDPACLERNGATKSEMKTNVNTVGDSTNLLLTDWFARKKVNDTVIFVTIFINGTKQVHSITNEFVLLQSRSVFYEHAKLRHAI